MSSFDYTDNFNGFNDLINRADFLTEMKIGKAHPSFKGLARRIQDDPRSGGKGWPRDARMLIKTVLYNVDIFTEEDIKALRASGVEASREYREALEALLDKYEDEIKDKASDIADELEKQFESFVNDQGLMVGAERKEMYLAKREAKAAADKFEKEIEGGGDVVDAVEDAVDDVEQVISLATKQGLQSLKMSKEDPTTMIEIRIEDPSKAEVVKDMVKKYANEHLDVEGNSITFSADPGTPLADAVSRHGVDKIEAALKRDVDAISNSVVVVMKPDEGEEDDMYGMEGDDSYAANENEVQDEEYKGIKHKFSKEYRDKVDDEFKDHIKMRRRTPQGTSGVKLPPGPADDPDKYKDEIDKYLAQGYEIEDNELDHFLTKEQPEDNIPTDYEEVLDALVDDDKKKHAMKKLNGDDDDPGHIDDMRAEYPPDPFGGGYEDEEGDDEEQDVREMAENILGNLEDRGYRELAARGISGVDDDYDDDAINMLYNLVDQGWTRGSEAFRLARRIADFGRSGLEEERPFETGFENEEEFSYSPMLDSYKTSTANYLTEQAASDKRNKKTEVKNQSFTEKYKPKTHWQLEELRRYGL